MGGVLRMNSHLRVAAAANWWIVTIDSVPPQSITFVTVSAESQIAWRHRSRSVARLGSRVGMSMSSQHDFGVQNKCVDRVHMGCFLKGKRGASFIRVMVR